jgi:hypothetical protein
MNPERFLGIFVMIGTIAGTLLMLALFEHEAASKVPYDCTDPNERERIREIALKGIDDGLQSAVAHLYDIWTKDPNTQQPARAQVGVTNAINSHIRARTYALAWNPPTCPPEK